MQGTYQLVTLGCKVNQYETQVVREWLDSRGFRPAKPGERVDVAVVNTCAVTGGASRKSRQAVRRASRGGRTPVVVIGCGATADADRLRHICGVKAVLGHDEDVRLTLGAILDANFPRDPRPEVARPAPFSPRPVHSLRREDDEDDDIRPMQLISTPRDKPHDPATAQVREIISLPVRGVKGDDSEVERIHHFDGHQRAFLKIQDGCDAFCTYCIIPRLRPRLSFKPIDAAVAEARTLVASGHREIILTGIFLGAYGRPTALRRRLPDDSNPLARLVDALARVEGLDRLRLSSLEPGDVDDDLLDVLARHPNCVPHLHLPLQSGSQAILQRMNRQYTRDEFHAMIERVRSALDRPALSTDVIVGFPGETEEDFQASIDAARHARFCKIHAFPFSPREKTAAARWMKDFVPPEIVRERMSRLAQVEIECSLAFRRDLIGTVERVIVEGEGVDGFEEENSHDPETSNVDSLERRNVHGSRGRDFRSKGRIFHGPEGGTFDEADPPWSAISHGRSDRYFEIHFEDEDAKPGDLVRVRVDRVTPTRTHGTRLHPGRHPLPVLPQTI